MDISLLDQLMYFKRLRESITENRTGEQKDHITDLVEFIDTKMHNIIQELAHV